MSIIAFVIVILLIAGLAWLVRTQATWVGEPFQTIIFWVLVIAALLVTLNALGVLDELRSLQMPHV